MLYTWTYQSSILFLVSPFPGVLEAMIQRPSTMTRAGIAIFDLNCWDTRWVYPTQK